MRRTLMPLLGIIILITTATSFAGDCGDVDNSGSLNILDVGYTISYLYKGGPAPFCEGEPILTTADVSEITSTTAQCGGTITSDGGATVTARGVCWSTNLTPTVADNKTTDGTGGGSFTSSITGLTYNTLYYVRAYATNSAGTGYGIAMAFTTSPISPVLTTADVSEITQTTAQCGGNITSDGGAAVTARGVCWSINPTPTVADNKTTDGTGPGSYASSIIGLTRKTTYYVAAYATNSVGTNYGSITSFKTTDSMGTVTDVDGNIYKTVKIGNQWWMAENLKAFHFRNGNDMPIVPDDQAWWDLTTGAFCHYDNDFNNVATYGRLYNWYAVNDSRSIAPEGWHVPSDAEWQTLIDYLGGDGVAGGKMNESGFAALPGGLRFWFGAYSDVGESAYFWSSTGYGGSAALYRQLAVGASGVIRDYINQGCGFSVRCVKD